MKRRYFIALLGGAGLASSRISLAQSTDSIRKIGALFSQAETDPEGQARATALRQGLNELGWMEGGNLRIEWRWTAGSLDRMRGLAADLVRQNPEVILAGATTALVALQSATRTVPIVFVQVTDPVGAGFIASLAKPGGNITGLTQHEFSISEKWLELLKQIAPHVARIAILYDPSNPAAEGYLRAVKPPAPTFDLRLFPLPVRNGTEIARAINEFALEPGGGLMVLPGPVGAVNRDLIIALAARHRLPAIYAFRYHAVSGGLISYGVDNIELYRRAAWYIDRILKGGKPGELPVQHATRFQLVVNLKTAKALGLTIPLSLLTRADEVIE